MSIYANGINISMNEVGIITFMENGQEGAQPVAKIAMLYEVVKLLHKALGEVIEQHDAKLGQLQRTKENMN